MLDPALVAKMQEVSEKVKALAAQYEADRAKHGSVVKLAS